MPGSERQRGTGVVGDARTFDLSRAALSGGSSLFRTMSSSACNGPGNNVNPSFWLSLATESASDSDSR